MLPGGWLRTGDLGYADEQGYLFIVDRLKELIKLGLPGAPAQLEAVLLEHPAVADAAVVRSPHPEAGEVPKAFVVRNGDADADELMEFAAARVAPYKKVRLVEFVDEIPGHPRERFSGASWSNASGNSPSRQPKRARGAQLTSVTRRLLTS